MKTDFKSTVKCERARSTPRYKIGLFLLIESITYPYYYLEKYIFTDDSYLVRIFDCNFEHALLNYYSEEYLTENISKRDFTEKERINLMFTKNKIDLTWEA